MPEGLVLQEGSALDLPLSVLNEGSAAFGLRSLTCRSGSNDVRVDLGGRVVGAGGRELVGAPVEFPRAGHFNLEVGLELEWTHAARLGFGALLPDAVEITTRHDGPLISAHSEGTGNLVNVSGAADRMLSDALRTRGPSEASKARRAMHPIPATQMDGFGDDHGIVSWATTLELPDMLSWGAPLRSRPRPWCGVVLGRDRPHPAIGLSDDRAGTDAALRFPPDLPEACELTRTISRRHWRLYPWDGRWWIEQLGREPTALVHAGGRRRLLRSGDRAPLPAGARIYALGGAHRRLGFELLHISVARGQVLRSALRRC